MQAKGNGVIYIFRDKFQIYTSLMSNILEFRFIDDIVHDLDVVNKELLENILKIFIDSNKIIPCNLVITLSDSVCFVQDFELPIDSTTSAEQNKAQPKNDSLARRKSEMREKIEKFLEHVPFEDVASQRISIPNGARIYATNQDLFEVIKTVFEQKGFYVDAVVPGAVIGNNFSSLEGITPTSANSILQALPLFKKNNMLIQQPHAVEKPKIDEKDENVANIEIAESEAVKKTKPKTNKKRLVLLSGVFGFLIILLVVVYISSNQSSSTSVQAQPISTVEPVTNP
jgi:hypothetical protein